MWQKIVLFQDSYTPYAAAYESRLGDDALLSPRVRVPGDHQTVDVLADHGRYGGAHAMGEDARAAAIEYCIDVSERAAAEEDIAEEEEEEEEEGEASGVVATGIMQGQQKTSCRVVLDSILDPFCGYGSVLAVANAYAGCQP